MLEDSLGGHKGLMTNLARHSSPRKHVSSSLGSPCRLYADVSDTMNNLEMLLAW